MEQTASQSQMSPSKADHDGLLTPPNGLTEAPSSCDTEMSEPLVVAHSEGVVFEHDILRRLTIHEKSIGNKDLALDSPFHYVGDYSADPDSDPLPGESCNKDSTVLSLTPVSNTSKSSSPVITEKANDNNTYMDVEFNVDVEWLGTSQYYTQHGVELQVNVSRELVSFVHY